MSSSYDFIICGAGCAGLSLAHRLCDSTFSQYSILILDQSPKDVNDRTWSFWTKQDQNPFKAIYKKSWNKLAFYAPDVTSIDQPQPYSYNTIAGIDFYKYVMDEIAKCDHLTFCQERVEEVIDQDDRVTVRTTSSEYTSKYVFDSIVKKMPLEHHLFVWQHFMGWEVETDENVFDDTTATFMDFRIDQQGETRFVYVLPFSKNKALVEATLFTKELWTEDQYEEVLGDYMNKYVTGKYRIESKELGKIPMTTAIFNNGTKRIIPIGTNNSVVKPSSGYAFTRIQREADILAGRIKEGKIRRVKPKSRFLAYDRTLLNVLITGKEYGARVFSDMFRYNDQRDILNFLDETSSIFQEIKIFNTLPFWSFLKAFIRENVFNRTK